MRRRRRLNRPTSLIKPPRRKNHNFITAEFTARLKRHAESLGKRICRGGLLRGIVASRRSEGPSQATVHSGRDAPRGAPRAALCAEQAAPLLRVWNDRTQLSWWGMAVMARVLERHEGKVAEGTYV